ncbi:hypothetical protein [Daejeonella oryzae]|uniref:hypothetical protein n=1 Tax=Daejeonella oryzae TaxID=1122943 RepID=UPI0004067D47|nr:hypothetical protein [Daejeonella oryzae]
MHSSQQVKLIADSLLETFLPKDENQNSITFNFTIAPKKTYRVNYEKKEVKGKAEWTFVNYSEVII